MWPISINEEPKKNTIQGQHNQHNPTKGYRLNKTNFPLPYYLSFIVVTSPIILLPTVFQILLYLDIYAKPYKAHQRFVQYKSNYQRDRILV